MPIEPSKIASRPPSERSPDHRRVDTSCRRVQLSLIMLENVLFLGGLIYLLRPSMERLGLAFALSASSLLSKPTTKLSMFQLMYANILAI